MVVIFNEVSVLVTDAVVSAPDRRLEVMTALDEGEEEAGGGPPDPEAVAVALLGTGLAVVRSLVPGFVSVIGHIVVETAMVDVMTLVESAGQLVTVGAHLVIVTSLVV